MSWRCSSFLIAGSGAYFSSQSSGFKILWVTGSKRALPSGKIFPDGKARFDPVTHKILKPDDWEEKYAPEPAIKKELQRQLKAYERHKERNKS